ncbi:antitoxin VbhA family protein [Peribacillus sp. NPDC097225]|uniref:antitoxin VbhA family protein n=1 Tax=Peribacillus sp. NPDC097225 TaxID=3364400 RepID=UPI003800A3E9
MKDLETFKKQFNSVKNSMAVEGLIVTPEIEDLVFKKATGKMTHDEFIREALLLANQAGKILKVLKTL